MSFKQIIDQDIAKKILQGAIREKRLAHAYLFTGPAGVGKWFTAIQVAKAVNCLKEADDSCDDCTSCRKVSRLIHPDLNLIFPLPPVSAGRKGKKEKEEEEQGNRAKFIQEKIANPYRIVKFEKPGSISIDEIRNAQKRLQYTPMEGKVKVLIVQDRRRCPLRRRTAF